MYFGPKSEKQTINNEVYQYKNATSILESGCMFSDCPAQVKVFTDSLAPVTWSVKSSNLDDIIHLCAWTLRALALVLSHTAHTQ